MAAIITRPGLALDGRKLFHHVMREVAAYARPLFIRLQVRGGAGEEGPPPVGTQTPR